MRRLSYSNQLFSSTNQYSHTRMMNYLKEENKSGDHFLTPEQLETVYRTDCKRGLTEEFAWENLLQYGPNVLKDLKGNSYWSILRRHLCGWYQWLLWIGALLNYVAYIWLRLVGYTHSYTQQYLYLATVISIFVLSTGFLGFYFEVKRSVMSGFEKIIPKNTAVVRNGIRRRISNCDITVGDIVEMRSGEVVPADIRILTCSNFTTDMSLLTGAYYNTTTHTVTATNANPLESRNMCYFGCPVMEGDARGMVVAVGEQTVMGKIAGLVTGLKHVETPIDRDITCYMKVLCLMSLIFGISFYILFYFRTHNFIFAYQYVLGIIVANFPEGLIVSLTLCMLLSSRMMRRLHCKVKTLHAVETIGATSCIFLNTHGTLTGNILSVSHLYCNFTIYDKDDRSPVADKSYNELCRAACLNIMATFKTETIKLPLTKRKILGSSDDTALLYYLEMNRSATMIQKKYPRVAELPYSTSTGYRITIHEIRETNSYLIIMKGTPEIVIKNCSSVFCDDGVIELTPNFKKNIEDQGFLKLANMGESIIGYSSLQLLEQNFPLGYKFETQPLNFPISNMVFLGAISLIDPPRGNIENVITQYHEAGIRIIILTGEHPVTALAIARQCGIVTKKSSLDYSLESHKEIKPLQLDIKGEYEAAVITGDDLRHVSANEITSILQVYSELIFARISPHKKLVIVEQCQQLGHIVAVVGSGINDSPALKKADIGIAMGLSGTEVTKNGADMILLNDRLDSLLLGIKEGRRVVENFKKILAFTLTSNTAEMLPFILYVFLDMPLPLTLMLILIINVGTNVLLAMSLAFEECEEDIMKLPPRNRSDKFINSFLIYKAYVQIGMIEFFAGIFSYLIVLAEDGFFPQDLLFVRKEWENQSSVMTDSSGDLRYYNDRVKLEKKAQTAYFIAVCWTQISDVIICKTRRVSLVVMKMNCKLYVNIIITIVSVAVICDMSVCNDVFNTEPVPLHVYFLPVPFMILMIVSDELRKYIIRNNLSPWVSKELAYSY